jgi:hypothetical protein
VCIALRSALSLETESIKGDIMKQALFDATQHARELAVAPFLDQGLYQFFLGTGMGGESPSKQIALFVARTSYLYVLPPAVAQELVQCVLAFVCAMQSILTVLSILYWRRPVLMSGGDGGSGDDDTTPTATDPTAPASTQGEATPDNADNNNNSANSSGGADSQDDSDNKYKNEADSTPGRGGAAAGGATKRRNKKKD